jgi:hypothetical protein
MAGRAMIVAGLTIGWPLLQLLILFVRFGENALVNVEDEIAPYVFFGFLSGTFLSYALRRADDSLGRWGVVGGFVVALPLAQWATVLGAVSFPPWLGVPLAGLIAQFFGVAVGRTVVGFFRR